MGNTTDVSFFVSHTTATIILKDRESEKAVQYVEHEHFTYSFFHKDKRNAKGFSIRFSTKTRARQSWCYFFPSSSYFIYDTEQTYTIYVCARHEMRGTMK